MSCQSPPDMKNQKRKHCKKSLKNNNNKNIKFKINFIYQINFKKHLQIYLKNNHHKNITSNNYNNKKLMKI